MTWPPLTNEMPDLSALVPGQTLALVLRLAFPGDRTDAYPARLLHVTFVRLVDKAISEYEAARAQMNRYSQEDTPMRPLVALFRAGSEFENCITSLYRALCLLEAIRRDKVSPKLPDALRATLRAKADVRNFRDAIQHFDDDLANGVPQPGGNLGIRAHSNRVECARGSILYSDLAGWLRSLHGYAGQIAA
jgi:hypothetical protein